MRGIKGWAGCAVVMTLAACGGPHGTGTTRQDPGAASLPRVSSRLALAAKDVDSRTMAPGSEYVLNVTVTCASTEGAGCDLDLLLDAVKGKPSRWAIKDAASGKLLPTTWDGRGFVMHLESVPGNGHPLNVQLLLETPDVDAPLVLELATTVVTTDDDPRILFEEAAGLELVVVPRPGWAAPAAFLAASDVAAAGMHPDVVP